jgi:hypothetical protein
MNYRLEARRLAAFTVVLMAAVLAIDSCATELPNEGLLSRPPELTGVLPTPLGAAIDAPVVTTKASQASAADNCQISISRSQFDYGRFSKRDLSSQGVDPGTLVVGRQTSLVNVSCRAPQRVALSFRGVSTVDGLAYQFGGHGEVRLTLLNAQADGQSVQLGEGDAGVPASAWAERAALLPNRGVTLQSDRPVSRLSMQLEVVATVPTEAKAPVTAQHWSDSGQLQLHTY